MKPEIRQAADEIRYFWSEVQVALTFDRLRETDSGAVRAMLTATSTNGNGHAAHIFWAQVSVTTASDRRTVTAKLDSAAPVQGGWERDIDRCFQDVYQRHTAVPEPSLLTPAEEPDLNTAMLIDPVLPVGLIALLLADQGSTKSFFMLYLAVCVCLGCETVFGEPSRRGPVIFFDWEVDEPTARRRLAWICRGLGVDPPDNLYYVDMSTRGRIFDRIRDMRYMVDRIKPVMVVIDSLTFATGADLNSAEYAAPTMTAVGSLGEGVTKLISTHPNKGSRNAKTEDISVIGSGLFEFRARTIWHMRREDPRGSRFGVSLTSRKPSDGPPQQPLAYRMIFDNTQKTARFERSRLRDMPGLERETLSLTARIRKALGKHGKLDTNDLAAMCGAKPDVVRVECNRMMDVAPFIGSEGGRGNATVWMLLAQAEDDPEDDA